MGGAMIRWTDRDGVEWTPLGVVVFAVQFVVIVTVMLVLDVVEWLAGKVRR